jgi:uncharacterized integral membrane protein
MIVGIVLGAVTVIFALQNVAPITVSFFSWHITGSLSVVLFSTLVAGAVVSLLFSVPEAIRNYMLFRNLKKQNKVLQDELAALKQQQAMNASSTPSMTNHDNV